MGYFVSANTAILWMEEYGDKVKELYRKSDIEITEIKHHPDDETLIFAKTSHGIWILLGEGDDVYFQWQDTMNVDVPEDWVFERDDNDKFVKE